MKQIGQVIRKHRKLSGLSQIELAEIAGVGKTLIFDIEQGKDTIQFAGLKKVLDALNIKIKLESPVMNKLMNPNETNSISDQSPINETEENKESKKI